VANAKKEEHVATIGSPGEESRVQLSGRLGGKHMRKEEVEGDDCDINDYGLVDAVEPTFLGAYRVKTSNQDPDAKEFFQPASLP
jgi:hypothetical protein